MKKLNKIIISSLVTLELFISGAGLSCYGNNSFPGEDWRMLSDSSVKSSPVKVDSFDLLILPPSSGVQFYKVGIIFPSATKNEEKMVPEHLSFGASDAYYSMILDTIMGEHTLFSEFTSFPYPCEAVTFNNDFTVMYFTKISKKDNREKIHMAKYSAGDNGPGWILDETPINFCSDNYAYSHPALSADGQFMIFASDKKGAVGGMDLFKSNKEGDTWSAPRPLGAAINTLGNELFPFLDSANNLFFSSDGLPGFGGYDLFLSKINGKDWNESLNLSKRINSGIDDVAFTVSRKDELSAFYTTKQKTVKGGMQLYKLTLSDENDSINQSLPLSTILYNMALLENDFPVTKVTPYVEPVQVAPVTVVTAPVVIIPEKTQPAVKPPEPKVEPKVEPVQTPPVAAVVAPALIIPEKTQPQVKPAEQKVVPKVEPKVEPKVVPKVEPKVEPVKVIPSAPKETDIVVVYKVQIQTTTKAKGNDLITVNGKSYKTSEYLYKGEYRYTVGEFSTLKPAVELQNDCRASGYPKAFVVAFKNNERTLDPALFK